MPFALANYACISGTQLPQIAVSGNQHLEACLFCRREKFAIPQRRPLKLERSLYGMVEFASERDRRSLIKKKYSRLRRGLGAPGGVLKGLSSLIRLNTRKPA